MSKTVLQKNIILSLMQQDARFYNVELIDYIWVSDVTYACEIRYRDFYHGESSAFSIYLSNEQFLCYIARLLSYQKGYPSVYVSMRADMSCAIHGSIADYGRKRRRK